MAAADWKLALMVLDRFADEDDTEVAAMLEGVSTERLKRVIRAMAAVACMCVDELAQAQRADFEDVLDAIMEASEAFFAGDD